MSDESNQAGRGELQRRPERSPDQQRRARREAIERVAGVYYAGCRRVAAGINKLKGYLDGD